MKLANYPELMKLPKSEKLKLADELWLAGISDAMPVPAEQARTLDARWASYRTGKTKRISMAELERRLKKK
jgi:putative addiction module component (TIGR02574 family)